MSHLQRYRAALACLSVSLLVASCGPDGAPNARRLIREQHAPRVQALLLDMLTRHERGLKQAADRISAGFVKVSGVQQETDMRSVMKLVRSPKRGVPELVISPMSFLAVVGKDGHCIARDLEPDRMKGMDLGGQFPVVAGALQGKTDVAMGEFTGPAPAEADGGVPSAEVTTGKPSVTVLMAAPSHRNGEVVGAMVLGIPLWRLQQVLTKQLQMELAGKDRVVIWVYVYRGDELHSHGTPPDLDKLVPDGNARRAGLAKSPGGFTGETQQFGFWYGYGVRPLRALGPDIGVVIFRMESEDKPKE